jgi:RNA polymerase sigma-70 factor (ECF subfamily)
MANREDPRPGGAAGRFTELLDRYGQVLRRTIVHLCPKDLGLDFDDLEQEARLRLWRSLERATDIRHPASYLYRLAASVTVDAIRRVTARREQSMEEPNKGSEDDGGRDVAVAAADVADPGVLAERRIELQRVQAALGAMPAERRRAVGLHLQGFTSSEIAELAGWSEAKSRSLVYRGLDELRGRLAESEGER